MKIKQTSKTPSKIQQVRRWKVEPISKILADIRAKYQQGSNND